MVISLGSWLHRIDKTVLVSNADVLGDDDRVEIVLLLNVHILLDFDGMTVAVEGHEGVAVHWQVLELFVSLMGLLSAVLLLDDSVID